MSGDDSEGTADRAQAVTGGCLCGAVRYEARAHLSTAYYCHCRMCQRSSGSPAEVAVMVEPGSLRFTAGAPTFYRSSGFGERGFCAVCGSRLLWRLADASKGEFTNLSVGSLDEPETAVPTEHLCIESRLSWYRPNPELPGRRSDEIPELVEAWKQEP